MATSLENEETEFIIIWRPATWEIQVLGDDQKPVWLVGDNTLDDLLEDAVNSSDNWQDLVRLRDRLRYWAEKADGALSELANRVRANAFTERNRGE